MRTLFSLVCVVSFATVLAAKEAPAFVSKEGGFSVQFPGKPKAETKTTRSAAGELRILTSSYGVGGGFVLSVAVIEYPPNALKGITADALLTSARDGLKGKKDELLAEKEMPFGPDKLASREVIVEKGKSVVRVRLIVRDNRLYQLLAIGTKEQVTGKTADAFLASFELTK